MQIGGFDRTTPETFPTPPARPGIARRSWARPTGGPERGFGRRVSAAGRTDLRGLDEWPPAASSSPQTLRRFTQEAEPEPARGEFCLAGQLNRLAILRETLLYFAVPQVDADRRGQVIGKLDRQPLLGGSERA